MVRNLLALGAVVLFSMAALPKAAAEEAASDERIDLSSMTHEELCELVRRCQNGEMSDRCREARRGARDAWRRLLDRLNDIERRLDELESDRDDDEAIKRELERLAALLDDLNDRMNQLAQLELDVAALNQRLSALENQHGQDLNSVRERLNTLESRIAVLLDRLRRFQLGIVAGGVGLLSLDGSSYVGFLAGPRAAVRAAHGLEVFLELQMAIGDDPENEYLGVRGRGGLQAFVLPDVLLEFGFSSMWVGYDDMLQASNTYLMGDIGFQARPIPELGFGAAVTAGVHYDREDPDFAFGVVLTVGGFLPRW